MMIRQIIKKTLTLLFSLFFIATFTFYLMKSIPGDPFLDDNLLSDEILHSLRSHYGLDKPLHIQYFLYLKGLLTFDFGPSYIYVGRNVSEIILENFPVSALLGIEALVISLFFGILLGSFSAIYKGKWQDNFTLIFSILGISVPSFLLATLLQYFFGIKFDLLPIARWGSFSHSILPAISLAAMPTAFIARLVRNNILEVLHQDYILAAKAKGLSSFRILIFHVLRNALLPVVSYLGPLSAKILTGSFIIEKIFSIPGLGQWLILSISNRDYTVIMGITLFFSVLLLLIIYLSDLLYALIDPRIQSFRREL